MKILTRYILTQFFKTFFMWLITAFIVVSAAWIGMIVAKQGLPFHLIPMAFLSSVPQILGFAIPVACFFGGTICFAKMASFNELIAVRAMGVPLWRMFLPIWIVTFVLSFPTTWFTDLSYSEVRKAVSQILFTGMEKMIPARLAEEGRFSDPDNNIVFDVVSVDSKTDELKHISIQCRNPPLNGEAESGRIKVDLAPNPPILYVELTNLIVKSEDGLFSSSGKELFKIGIPSSFFGGGGTSDPSIMEVKDVLRTNRERQEELQRQNAVNLAFAMVRGDIDTFQNNEWIGRWNENEYLTYMNRRAELAPYRYFAAGFFCFFFVWFGIPLVIRHAKPANYWMVSLSIFILTLLIACPLLGFGCSLAKDGILPPWICWIGNAVLAVIGAWQLKIIHKH